MSNILAEVEGIGKGTCVACNGTKDRSYNGTTMTCKLCDEDGLVLDSLPDYPNDLEACMRVARKMGYGVSFNTNTIEVFMGGMVGTWIVEEAMITDSDNLATTLYPMLVEIAEERKKC